MSNELWLSRGQEGFDAALAHNIQTTKNKIIENEQLLSNNKIPRHRWTYVVRNPPYDHAPTLGSCYYSKEDAFESVDVLQSAQCTPRTSTTFDVRVVDGDDHALLCSLLQECYFELEDHKREMAAAIFATSTPIAETGDECTFCCELAILSHPGCKNCVPEIMYCQACRDEHPQRVIDRIQELQNCKCKISWEIEHVKEHEDKFILKTNNNNNKKQCFQCDKTPGKIYEFESFAPCKGKIYLYFCADCLENRANELNERIGEHALGCNQC